MKECNVYDENLQRIGTIGTWVSLLWNEGYSTLGTFVIEVQQTKKAAQLLKVGNYIGRSDFDTLCLIRSVEVNDGKIVANGHPAKGILKERVSTKVINNQNAENALRELVSSMAAWPCVALGNSANLADVFSREISDKTLLEYCEEICAEIDAGFRLRFDRQNKKLLFELYKPTENKNLIFAEKFRNLSEVVYSETDNDYKNVAIVAGAGEGENRITVTVGDTASTGAKRRELYVDARSLQKEEGESDEAYKTRLKNHGLEKLAEHVFIQNAEAVINSANFGTRFFLGDIVTLNLEAIGVKMQTRIIGFSLTSENNGEEIEIEYGTPIIRR